MIFKNFWKFVIFHIMRKIISHMTQHTSNIQNRKLKKQVLGFLSRLGFGAGKLPMSGRLILVMGVVLAISLLFPWIQVTSINNMTNYSAFSSKMWFMGYWIVLAVITIFFFLLSHTKKEHIRAQIPFRLSDTQAVVFVASMIVVCMVHTLLLSNVYTILGGVQFLSGFFVAFASSICIIVWGFFLSKKIKNQNTESYYLDKQIEENFWEYKNIIQSDIHQENKRKKQNMTLPF